ncbi:MAG: hypothetical protein KDA89_00560 [Planctomycetaceae bacterium]|nr:hypothetical protein [Planctomycetaceae bacterium]
MTRRINYIDPVTGREIISYPQPTVHIPTHIPQQHYPTPVPMHSHQMMSSWETRQSENRGIRASFIVGGLVVGFLAIAVHPALGLGIWGYVLVKATYWAIKGT